VRQIKDLTVFAALKLKISTDFFGMQNKVLQALREVKELKAESFTFQKGIKTK
jgi:hypothetical protein